VQKIVKFYLIPITERDIFINGVSLKETLKINHTEISTNTKTTADYPAALGVRSVSKQKAEEYYYSSNYAGKIQNFINDSKIVCELPFGYYYDIVGYIDGKLNG